MYNFFTSIEFYVIACVVAAAIVIISAMPKQVGEARQFLLGGFLCFDTDEDDEPQPTQDHVSSPNPNPNYNAVNYPSNVSVSFGANANITPNANANTNTGEEASIVEVTNNGYRNIPASNASNSSRKGKKQSKGQNNAPIPGWITGSVEGKEPEIDLLCMEDGTVKLIRRGLNGVVTADGAVSLACTLIGFDLKIEERLTYGGRNLKDPAPTEAVFSLEFLAPNEHYHIHYNSDTIHRMAAFTLATREGIHIVKTLN